MLWERGAVFKQEVAARVRGSGRGSRRRAARAARGARRSGLPLSARPVADGSAEGPGAAAGRTPFRLALARFRRDRTALAAAGVLLIIALFAALAPLWAQLTGHPYHATFPETGLDAAGQPARPGPRVLAGCRPARPRLSWSAPPTARGSPWSSGRARRRSPPPPGPDRVVAGFCGGVVDTVLARLMDVTLALPYLLVAITLATTFPVSSVAGGLAMTILVVAFFSVASFGRVVRGQVLSLRRREFIEAARALGASNARIMVSEVLPNLTAQITVLTSLLLPGAIVAEATLSFLGVGVRPPMPSWGSMLGEGGDVFQTAWWLLAVPGALLLLTTLAFNLLGEGIRDALGPRTDAAPGGR
ncbi:ABC transporter permease [Actinomadura sp. CNU-125]|uniref:ABC transporter permease n=1 Tax=Actinomadura sp. CNU-125 TaxID=1904961 RepID=UPI000A94FD65|nr:ABC transporter permease [Actinomadura sp. CNU-125]